MSVCLRKVIVIMAVLSSVALAGCSSATQADLDVGKQARRDGDFNKAIENLQPLAGFGLPEAQYELALTLMSQKAATPEDLRQAKSLLEALAKTDHPQANFQLGKLNQKTKNNSDAKSYYMRSAELGYIRGFYEAGVVSEQQNDYSGAEGLYKKAFDGHYYKAAKKIARLYEKGLGRDVDFSAALSWYSLAQKHGVSGLEKKIESLQSKGTAQ